MAIFHLSATAPIARSSGQSATAAAAYRAGIIIFDERTGRVHDYSSKRGVLSSLLLLPGGAQLADRAQFWNRVEIRHRRGDAVLAREIIVALPDELNVFQRQGLAEALGREIADRFSVAVDISVHAPSRHGDQRNFHAHLLQSACLVDPGGALGKKAIQLDPIHCSRAKIADAIAWLRPRWEALVNTALEGVGSSERVDHRSNSARGIEKLPTIHEGVGDGASGRRRANATRKKVNVEAAGIDVQVAELLRERALVEAVAKTAAADALAQVDSGVALAARSVNRTAKRTVARTTGLAPRVQAEASMVHEQNARAPTAPRSDASLQLRIAGLTRQRSDTFTKSTLLAESIRKAESAETVRQALEDLQSASERAVAAQQSATKLLSEIQAHRWWWPWRRLSKLTKQHELAERLAHLRARELAETERESRAPVREVLQAEQRLLAAALLDFDFELGHLRGMLEGFTQDAPSASRPMIGSAAVDQPPFDGGANMRRL